MAALLFVVGLLLCKATTSRAVGSKSGKYCFLGSFKYGPHELTFSDMEDNQSYPTNEQEECKSSNTEAMD